MIDVPENITRINLGCGDKPLAHHLNVDAAPNPGVDAVFDLTVFPWPLPDSRFSRVVLWDVLEHLPNTIRTVEEVWRICSDGAEVQVRVPYWNSRWAWLDPQHVRPFHENTFDFFDPSKKYCQQRPYYSHARFHIASVVYEGCWFFLGKPWTWRVPENKPKRILHGATKLCDMVHFLQFDLRALK